MFRRGIDSVLSDMPFKEKMFVGLKELWLNSFTDSVLLYWTSSMGAKPEENTFHDCSSGAIFRVHKPSSPRRRRIGLALDIGHDGPSKKSVTGSHADACKHPTAASLTIYGKKI